MLHISPQYYKTICSLSGFYQKTLYTYTLDCQNYYTCTIDVPKI